MSANFNDILNQPVADIADPELLPAGLVALTVLSYETGESSRKKTPYVQVNFSIDDYLEADDESELAAFGNAAGKKTKTQFYMSPNAQFMLRDFLQDHVQVTEGATIAEQLEEAKGLSCAGRIDHEFSEDGERTFARLNKTLPL